MPAGYMRTASTRPHRTIVETQYIASLHPQPHVSRLERLDLRVAQVNTIASYANALGGSLHLTIELRGARFDVPIAADAAIDPAA